MLAKESRTSRSGEAGDECAAAVAKSRRLARVAVVGEDNVPVQLGLVQLPAKQAHLLACRIRRGADGLPQRQRTKAERVGLALLPLARRGCVVDRVLVALEDDGLAPAERVAKHAGQVSRLAWSPVWMDGDGWTDDADSEGI